MNTIVKVKLLAAGLLVSAAATVYAQTDSTRRQSSPAPESRQQQQPSNQFNSQDYSTMQSSDVPASLRGTLQGTTYRGWEQGQLYRHNNGEGYWLRTGTGANQQDYYFDRNGKAMENRSGTQGSQGTQGTTGTPKRKGTQGSQGSDATQGTQPSQGTQPVQKDR